ncbi:uncharacterized protein LOC100372786 [Saccoglossus kowalevskii]|uniref:Uncharacterized protein LOC100372786 n=1 Tax=Saccoglossus kowalevskii TaxID=10224 RepID=A0ABM0GVU6_SACKO|nr:PREDICTED: uncharacterized protein LOC100372786 [Saccoglossus kowalevskii]
MAASFLVRVFFTPLFVYISQFITCSAQSEDSTTENPSVKFTEIDVWGFRLWQVAGMVLAAILVCIVIACCFSQKRIPRTKKEIEARHKKRMIVEKYANEMNRLHVKDLPKPPREMLQVEAELQQAAPKKRKSDGTKGRNITKKLFKGRNRKTNTQHIEESSLVHNPITSDPELTADPRIIEEPLGGYHRKPGQSARQYTLSNL